MREAGATQSPSVGSVSRPSQFCTQLQNKRTVASTWKRTWIQTKWGTDTPSTDKILMEEVKLEEQLKEAVEEDKQALADTEGSQQSSQKLVEAANMYSIQGFCEDSLEVADVLEKATLCVPEEEIKDNNPHLKNLCETLTMSEVQFQEVFSKHCQAEPCQCQVPPL
ncbi:grpE protein homolog 1, mitochondrial-like [Macaca thibetana thibetana]|uniref:grpE protein homolog 1, mitochondrial-like n=1 Tax=Macaca thibetana thibetana TaxID=257877 RepID=UPI0021BCAF2B|nr:grpE protein homolog 1, mitochondrial-like [Macaca thibetana thibetana]